MIRSALLVCLVGCGGIAPLTSPEESSEQPQLSVVLEPDGTRELAVTKSEDMKITIRASDPGAVISFKIIDPTYITSWDGSGNGPMLWNPDPVVRGKIIGADKNFSGVAIGQAVIVAHSELFPLLLQLHVTVSKPGFRSGVLVGNYCTNE